MTWSGRYVWYCEGCPFIKSILVNNIIGITSITHQPKRRHWIACMLYFLSIQFQQSWNVFFKKENFTLYITMFFHYSTNSIFNMSLKCKFYSTTAREITLKKKIMQRKQKEDEPTCLVRWPLWWHLLKCVKPGPPFLHPSSFGCPLIRAEQDGCLANKGRR